ncbi:hypothetical protein AB4Z30_26110 [Paenibacillus sp. 2TAF8]|jgi:hypothetical protein
MNLLLRVITETAGDEQDRLEAGWMILIGDEMCKVFNGIFRTGGR